MCVGKSDLILQGSLVRTSWRNRRASVRYRCAPATPGKIFLCDDQEFQAAWVLNLSTTGVGLLASRPLPDGAHLTVRVRSNQSKKWFDLSCRAVHISQQPSGEWILGCELDNPLTINDLDDLL